MCVDAERGWGSGHPQGAPGHAESALIEHRRRFDLQLIVGLLDSGVELERHPLAGRDQLAFDVEPAVADVVDRGGVEAHLGVMQFGTWNSALECAGSSRQRVPAWPAVSVAFIVLLLPSGLPATTMPAVGGDRIGEIASPDGGRVRWRFHLFGGDFVVRPTRVGHGTAYCAGH